MNFNAVGSGSSLAAYVNSLLEKTGTTAGGTGASNAGASPLAPSMQAAAAAALDKASHSFKVTTAQKKLEQQETSVASDLRAAMGKAGVALDGPVEFSVGSDGTLAVGGSDKDKAAVNSFLKDDKSKPGFASRIASLASDADALSTTIRQNAAISQAARYAGSPGGVMSLYNSLLTQQDTTSAVFSLSGSASSLSYPGVLSSQA
jgi:hypothetical protein